MTVNLYVCLYHLYQLKHEIPRDVQCSHLNRWYKIVIQCLSTCKLDNPLAKARGLSPRTGGQPMV